jgi:hypothetical protein
MTLMTSNIHIFYGLPLGPQLYPCWPAVFTAYSRFKSLNVKLSFRGRWLFSRMLSHRSLVEVDGYFRGAYCLHHQVNFYQTTWRSFPETLVFTIIAMRTWISQVFGVFLLDHTYTIKFNLRKGKSKIKIFLKLYTSENFTTLNQIKDM